MNIKTRYALSAILGLAVFGSASAQESVPMGGVKDGMEQGRPGQSEIPSSAPRVSDIDRLFDNAQDNNEAAKKANTGAGALERSATSPLNQALSLDATDLISVDYPNEEVRTILRNVADLYSLNLVVPDTLRGTTSIKLRDVTWRQIYNVVLEPVGYTFIEEGSIIKVLSKEALNYEPPVTEIFMINYAEAEKIAVTVKNLVDATKGGSVQVDKRTNALIVSERSSRMDGIRGMIERLDKPTAQIHIETRFIEVFDSDIKNIGVSWSSLRGMGVRAGPFNHTYERDSEGSRAKASNDAYNTGDVSFENGSGASMDGIGTSRGTLTDNLTGTRVLDLTSTGSTSVLANTFDRLRSIANAKSSTAVFSADQFGFVIKALMEQGGSRLVSNPTVVTLNNQEAEIAVGEQYPIPNYQYNEETGSLQVNGFEFRDIGIKLKVTPQVNAAGLITLRVEPEVSSRTDEVDFGSTGGKVPVIGTRRTMTQIALKDGYTMGIGGLMQSRGTKNGDSVPGLGKIPGVGRLFRSETKREESTNLLIFITARVLPSEVADFEDVFSQEMMEAVNVDPAALKNR